jgi:glycosylphosphatidylinositol transamidase (GPIT) subunit GPI8
MSEEKRKAEFPLYPRLADGGAEVIQGLLDRFKHDLKKAAESVISDFYCDITPHAESDHWTNYREQIVSGLCNYNNRKVQGEYDFAKIRRAIFKDFREEIIKDLNADLLKEVDELKANLKSERETCQRFHR